MQVIVKGFSIWNDFSKFIAGISEKGGDKSKLTEELLLYKSLVNRVSISR